jgi:hypothetical protein
MFIEGKMAIKSDSQKDRILGEGDPFTEESEVISHFRDVFFVLGEDGITAFICRHF